MDYAFAETQGYALHVKILNLTVVNFVKVCGTGVYFSSRTVKFFID
jgi:hypothetical protein